MVDLVVLAGGRGTRLGGQDKAALRLGGATLLERILHTVGVRGTAPLGGRVVVVGDTPVPAGVLRTLEDPPDGGPVAGIAAGLQELERSSSAEWVAVVAVDQPGAGPALSLLHEHVSLTPGSVDALCQDDLTGQRQWLLAVYRRSALQAALDRLPDVRDVSVRRLVEGMSWLLVAAPDSTVLGDVDTWDDLASWRVRLGQSAPDEGD